MENFLLTKIVATIGPASQDRQTIYKLISEGVRVFRINFSHGNFDDYTLSHENIRKESKKLNIPVAILGDLSGPKIRTGVIEGEGFLLQNDDTVVFVKEGDCKQVNETTYQLSTNYAPFIEEVKVGEQVLMDDGSIAMVCTKAQNNQLECKVLNKGKLTSNKGINLPDTDLSVPSLTDWDYKCIEYAAEKKFDFLALSFVRNGADIILLKEKLRELGVRPPKRQDPEEKARYAGLIGSKKLNFIPVISKIEKPQAIANLEEILEETDGIMVARGDLGVEMDLAEITIHQKNIIETSHKFGKPVIVATQMLQSMITSPSPTRAEVSDVANAILDGADAIMLSGETAVGEYPIKTVQIMQRVIIKTQSHLLSRIDKIARPFKSNYSKYRTGALADSVKTIVDELGIKTVVTWTMLGGTAVYLSQLRMQSRIIAFSNNKQRLNQIALLYGIFPAYMSIPISIREFFEKGDQYIIDSGLAVKGDAVVYVYGYPFNDAGNTNSVTIHYVGEIN